MWLVAHSAQPGASGRVGRQGRTPAACASGRGGACAVALIQYGSIRQRIARAQSSRMQRFLANKVCSKCRIRSLSCADASFLACISLPNQIPLWSAITVSLLAVRLADQKVARSDRPRRAAKIKRRHNG